MGKRGDLSSLDVTTNVLWNSVGKDVYQSPKEQFFVPDLIMGGMSSEEFKPLLANETRDVEKHVVSTERGGASWLMTSFLMVNTALGIGLLNFPSAYDQSGGILSATLIQLVLVVLMITTMLILAYCSDIRGADTYQDVLLAMCGRRAQHLSAVSITCTLYCVCVASLIIIGDQMDSLFLSIFGASFCHCWYLERHFTIPVVAVCLILPLCYCRRVDFLGYVGYIGIFAMLYPVFLTVYAFLTLDVHSNNIKTRPDDWAAMFAVIPVLGLGYQSQEVVVPIYSCMKERTLCNFTKSCFLAIGLLLLLYSITGCFGYLTYGSDVAHNVMKMFDPNDPVVLIGVGALIIKMIVTYPLLALCGRDAVVGLYAEIVRLTMKEFQYSEKTRRYVVATIWFTTTLALAVFTSGIGVVIKYMGCVACVNIYIFPGICLLRVAMKEDPAYERLKSRLLLALAIFITAFGAFSIGVILMQTIFSQNSETSNSVCT